MNETLNAFKRVLSYYDLAAIKAISREIGDKNNAIIVKSRLCNNEGITNSIMVNALKLLEVALIIETRSMGVKGTFIEVLDKEMLSKICEG